MKRFFAPNIDRRGRVARAIYGGIMLLLGGFLLHADHLWLAILAIAAGAFAWFEAGRSWCIVRACGIKTRW